MRLTGVRTDVNLFARCAEFRNQHVRVEPVDRALAAIDITLDNQDRCGDLRKFCPEGPLELGGVVSPPVLEEKHRVVGRISLPFLCEAVVEDSGYQHACRFLGDDRADIGSRGDLKSQVPASTASGHDDALSVDERQPAEVLDYAERIFHRVGGLRIDVTTAVRRSDEDVACREKPRPVARSRAVSSRRASGRVVMSP